MYRKGVEGMKRKLEFKSFRDGSELAHQLLGEVEERGGSNGER